MGAKTNEKLKVLWAILNGIYAFVFCFVFFVTTKSLYGAITKTPPDLFGYSVSEILSGSMEKSGFSVGDYVVTRRVSSEEQLEIGDIIVFYVHSDLTPVKKGESIKNALPIFHEIVDINENGEYITKGSSNKLNDKNPVPFTSVWGVYVKDNVALNALIKLFLYKNRFLYWTIAVLLVVIIRYALMLPIAAKCVILQRDILNGRRNLLEKECFELNVFKEFSKKAKVKLIKSVPLYLGIVYEYLLFGGIYGTSHQKNARLIKGKRCTIGDALRLAYLQEEAKDDECEKYINSLPRKNKKLERHRNQEGFIRESRRERINAFSNFFGCIAFAFIYFLLALLTKSIALAATLEPVAIAIFTVFCCSYLFFSLYENKSSLQKLKGYFPIINDLPDKYQFIINPMEFSCETILSNISSLENTLPKDKVQQ